MSMSSSSDPLIPLSMPTPPRKRRLVYQGSSNAAGGGGYGRLRRAAGVFRRPLKMSRFRFQSQWDVAGLTETRSLINPAPLPAPLPATLFEANNIYNVRDIAIDQYRRASAVAEAYSQYVITGCTIKFIPLVDTFPAGSPSIPKLYYMIDKSGTIPANITFDQMKNMGAKPIRMDDKEITVKWRPYTLGTQAATQAGGTVSGGAFPASWLSTNNNSGVAVAPFVVSSIDHFGIFFGVEQDVPGAQGVGYRVDLTIDVKYRKPLAINPSGVSAPTSLAALYDTTQLTARASAGGGVQ